MKHKCTLNRAAISRGQIVTGCDVCLPAKLQQGDSAKYYRDYQKAQYRKELTQPNQPRDFVRAYGADKAREHGYTDDQIRRYS